MSEPGKKGSSSLREDPPTNGTLNVRSPRASGSDAPSPPAHDPFDQCLDNLLDPGTTHVTPILAASPLEGPVHRRHRVLTQLEIGSEHFGFRLCRELGRGSFAWVFLAEQVDLAGRLVVLKFSSIEGTEPQTLAQMQHTHIVPIYSVHDNPLTGLRAVCMPYFGGATLAQVLDAVWADGTPLHGRELACALTGLQGELPAPPGTTESDRAPMAWFRGASYLRSVAWIGARLAEGLHHAHQRGVIHSDIKPNNILLGADGQPLLLDFNVAQNHSGSVHDSIVGGTISYSAPEHLEAMATPTPDAAHRVDRRSDLYSLGLVLYKMCTGRHAFDLSDVASSRKFLHDRAVTLSKMVPSARSHRPDLPWSLESILRKCLAPEPDQRYQHADQLAEDLRRFLSDDRLRHAPELSRVERVRKWTRRHPRWTSSGTVALAAGLLLSVAGAWILNARDQQLAAEERLALAQSRDRKAAYETGTQRALCLVNTVTDLPDLLPHGSETCERTLELYGVLDRDDWQQQPAWQTLGAEDRARMSENTRELLLLLAWSRVRPRPTDKEALNDALALLDRAEAIADLPPSQALALDRARYLELRGDRAEAERTRAAAAALKPHGAQDRYLSATVFARAGTTAGLKNAVAELDEALALNPRHYWALAQRGICRQELGDTTLAVSDFSTCIGLWPDFAWGYFNRGYLLARSGRHEHAVADFSAALERDPELVPAHLNRGLVRLEMKRYEPALADFERAHKLGRDDAFVHSGRGIALEGLRRFPESDAAFAEAFARLDKLSDAQRTRIHWVYGFAVLTRLPEKARAAFEEIVRSQPRHPQALFGLAQCAIERDDLDAALPFLDRAVEGDAAFVEARRGRAIVAARLGLWKTASQDINWCLEKEPHAGVTLYAAACVAARAAEKLKDAGMSRQALDLLQKAFAQNYGQDRAATDLDLAVLHNRPDFERLLAGQGHGAPPR